MQASLRREQTDTKKRETDVPLDGSEVWNFTPPEINSNFDTKISHLKGHPRNTQ